MAQQIESVGISDTDVARLLPALAEAARANEDTAARFVPPRPAILEEVSARQHQFVFGRRGVGKSTLLRRVAAGGSESPRGVIFIDIETLRRRPYPDVLIELLKVLLDDLDTRLRGNGLWRSWKRRKLRSRVRALSEAMSELLREPQSAEHTVTSLRSTAANVEKKSSVGVEGQAGGGNAIVRGELKAGAGITSSSASGELEETRADAKFQRTKMDGLVEAAILIRVVLGDAQAELAVPTLVVLDDFYHVARDDQPEVLAYLHQVVKGFDISLKICAVRHRVKPFTDGDPPVGMQPNQDAGIVSLDITLERFDVARQFLERVLEGICAPLTIDLGDLTTQGGRERLVLASGGVARDYLSLVRRALRNSTERPSRQFLPKNKITAEDVAKAAADLYEQKQEELKQDAGSDAEALRSRLSEIVRFCVERNHTNVFLIETTKLQEEDWGKEVEALADLRFVHRIDTLSTKRGGETYPGRKFAAFTLDLSTWTSTRSEQISPINFWEREGRQKIREPRLIYTPARAEGATSLQPKILAPTKPDAASDLEPGEQLVFEFDDQAQTSASP
jgi:hypothetical protein